MPGPAAPKNPNPTPRPPPHTAPTISNREKGHPRCGHPSPAADLPNQKGEQKANRERLRLETIATRTKQKPQPISNRENAACFFSQVGEGVHLPPGLGLGVDWVSSGMGKNQGHIETAVNALPCGRTATASCRGGGFTTPPGWNWVLVGIRLDCVGHRKDPRPGRESACLRPGSCLTL